MVLYNHGCLPHPSATKSDTKQVYCCHSSVTCNKGTFMQIRLCFSVPNSQLSALYTLNLWAMLVQTLFYISPVIAAVCCIQGQFHMSVRINESKRDNPQKGNVPANENKLVLTLEHFVRGRKLLEAGNSS